jgi:hypothetical protein
MFGALWPDYFELLRNLYCFTFFKQNVLMFLTAGDDVGQGLFLMNGREEVVSVLGPK